MASDLTGAAIITKFENMVDDKLDSDFAYQLMNDAKDEIEDLKAWLQLAKSQEYAVAAGYSHASALGSLPTRFANDERMVESTGSPEYGKVEFDDLLSRKNSPTGYFIDLNAGNLHLSGENHPAKTMVFFHAVYSADIEAATSWAFPGRFHRLIPLRMAEIYYKADAGEKRRAWNPEWRDEFQRGLALMETWDDRLKLKNRRIRRRGFGRRHGRYGCENPRSA